MKTKLMLGFALLSLHMGAAEAKTVVILPRDVVSCPIVKIPTDLRPDRHPVEMRCVPHRTPAHIKKILKRSFRKLFG